MKNLRLHLRKKGIVLTIALGFMTTSSFAQSVWDVINGSANHTSLAAALSQQSLNIPLSDPMGTFTVFAPDNDAIDDLATALGTDVAGILANPDLTAILTYHVLTSVAPSSAVSNGLIVTPMNTANTLKLTRKANDDIFVNQAQVNAPDLTATNGVVHSIDAVLLPGETVVDVAIDNGFTSLTAAVVAAELLPALTNPFGTFTVFAPTNDAFDDVASALGITIVDLLASPELANILLYHVLGSEVASGSVTNGLLATPLNTARTMKFTRTSTDEVFVNQAQVTLVDLDGGNGVVHVIDAVVLPVETVVDVAIDNGFTTLTAAVVAAELLPSLTDPFTELTVFAPTNTAFDNLAADLGVQTADLLALSNLGDILAYHVFGGIALEADLVAGPITMVSGQQANITLAGGAKINNANITLTDLEVDNGVVHVIDAVLIYDVAGIDESSIDFDIYPNPVIDFVAIRSTESKIENISVSNMLGQVVYNSTFTNPLTTLDLRGMEAGQYIVTLKSNDQLIRKSIVVSNK